MTTKISSVGLRGLEGYRVQVEVQILPGMESMTIVGLPDTSVRESKERVLSAIHSLDRKEVSQRIIVNLSPSEQKKNGPFFDLAIAVGILKESNQLKQDIPSDTAFLGALSLDGTIEKVEGLLPALLAAKELGFKRVFLPYDPLIPYDILDEVECIVVNHLHDLINYLHGHPSLPFYSDRPTEIENTIDSHKYQKDFSHIIGHEQAKQALIVAAAGGHNVLMSGPPGCGKSLLAETFPSILPPLSKKQQLEVISLYQLAKEKLPHPHLPPFRHPHHSASSVAIIGGGTYPKPGEISLAHTGVLFLDEMAEFTKKTLDMLRQPLETGKVTISRSHSTVTYPASFLLIGAMNPCPCGYLGSNTHYCTCTDKQIQAYHNRVSGPVYDRMDILLGLTSVNLEQKKRTSESSSEIRERVQQARERQFTRYEEHICNAKVPFEKLIAKSPLTDDQFKMLSQIAFKKRWSNRVHIKIIRLARTISDLSGEHHITDESIWKALQLRRTLSQDKHIALRKSRN